MSILDRLAREIAESMAALHLLQEQVLLLRVREAGGGQVVAPPAVQPEPWRVRARRPSGVEGPAREISPWAVPGMPEDMEHPLNLLLDLQSRESPEPASSPQSNPRVTHPRLAKVSP